MPNVSIAAAIVKKCKPTICEVGGGGNILPFFGDTEQSWNKFPLRAILYLCGLLWFFMGVAIVADIFMGAIERITSKKTRVLNKSTGHSNTVRVWNDTVANLTLMALGSSAPEILLSVIELTTNAFFSGDLGPSTIVGSAAFNLLIITAVCVMAIPDGELRLIKDVGVFAITASFSIFAYVWLYFIVLIYTPDEITIFEGALTFLFFPILVALAYMADRGMFTFGAKNADGETAPKCDKSHEMNFLGGDGDCDGWGCDGRFRAGGCKSGITGYFQTRGVDRYRCQSCDFDLCKKCVESNQKAVTHKVIGSDISREELANIELRILQEHGDALSDEDIARLIQKENAAPQSRATYRVKAVRSMVGGKRVPAPGEDSTYSMSSVVPVDGGPGGDQAKRPVLCPGGHSMHIFATHKANYNCDFCQKRFPTGVTMYGCRACNFDSCAECKDKFVKADATLQFCSDSYCVLECVGVLTTHVARSGDTSQTAVVQYRTRDGTATSHQDFVPIEGSLEFGPGEVLKTIEVHIVDDTAYEEDEDFYIDLFNPSSGVPGFKVALGAIPSTTISIVDDDQPGVLSFMEETMNVTEGIDNKVVTLTVKRCNGSNGTITCKYFTEDHTAIAGRDYLAVQGTLTFECGQMHRDIQLTILSGHHYDMTEEFRIILTEPTGGASFDTKTDGGDDSCICTIIVDSDEAARGRVDRVMQVLMMDWDKAQIGNASWRQQFWAAVLVNGGEEGNVSVFDWIMHLITVFWKVLFATIPPVDFCDGWLCFGCSLAMIGLVTAFISDLASLLGCTLNIPDKITAITFVALGTSLPDTFASKTAAEQDPYADASIGNVTGSNSVNVFLGLGLPWLVGAIYWNVYKKTDAWKEEYAEYPELLIGDEGKFVVLGGDLGFSVAVFSVTAIMAVAGLILRRKLYGGELGGPVGPKKVTAAILVSLWFVYIGLSSWMILKNLKPC